MKVKLMVGLGGVAVMLLTMLLAPFYVRAAEQTEDTYRICISGQDIGSSGLQEKPKGNYYTDYTIQYSATIEGKKVASWTQIKRSLGGRSWYGYTVIEKCCRVSCTEILSVTPIQCNDATIPSQIVTDQLVSFCKCNEEELKEALAEFKKYLQVYKDHRRQRKIEFDNLMDVYDRADKALWDFLTSSLYSLIKEAMPDEASTILNLNEASKTDDLKKIMDALTSAIKIIADSMGKEAIASAISKASWIAYIIDYSELLGTWKLLLDEAEIYRQRIEQYDEITHKLFEEKVYPAKQRWEKLWEECHQAKQDDDLSTPSESANQSFDYDAVRQSYENAERLNKNAQKILESWKKVGRFYEDTRGNAIQSEFSFERALKIASSRVQPFMPLKIVRASWQSTISNDKMHFAKVENDFSTDQISAFATLIQDGFNQFALTIQNWIVSRIEAESIIELVK
jgi:hypothetical protein